MTDSDRKNRYHDNRHHYSNWCQKCGLYYCWHPECTTFENDNRANHKFIPRENEDDYNWVGSMDKLPKKCVDCGSIFIDDDNKNIEAWFQCSNCGKVYLWKPDRGWIMEEEDND